MSRKKSPAFRVVYTLAIICFVAFSLGPILWSFIMSITPQSEMLANSTNFFPKNPTFQNYIKLIADSDQQGLLFRKGLVNSIKAAFLSLLLGIPFAVSFAYPLARIKFKGVKLIRDILLFTMAIPVFATIIPLYRLFVSLQLLDNLFGLVLVYITSFLPLTVWLLISYFDTLPRELEEAAYVDGCSRFGTMVRIILPISYPIIFAASLIVFLTTWNQFQIPLILAPSHATKPIAVVASEFVTKITVDYGLMNAGGILALIPPSIVAIVFRKFLITGIVGGATKG
ncbi:MULTISPECIES: carbohydrate ABC transporter permease [Oscillospiraceae]|uniref:Carbohydrate ABC transporter membrane protein 2 (CUT1 family) n=1 Tax=Harryflintia acetispora TaxID=1849041 RepID=A0A9X8UIE0_9FIRM|nr:MULTISPECIES: carbohydrate ABC transporter permease [Oscillospiraceae]TCL41881.1 carbohydrate ABC transporter membrane protein 2 (CUT1 family) [Harryflintia acetispora]